VLRQHFCCSINAIDRFLNKLSPSGDKRGRYRRRVDGHRHVIPSPFLMIVETQS
jgi:hypothetical protein